MRKYIFVGLFLTIIVSPLFSQKKEGRSGADFLSIPLLPEATGMGYSYVAVEGGARNVFWNPSLIAEVRGREFYAGYVGWYVESKVPYFSYTMSKSPYGNFAVFGSGVYSPNFQEATEDELLTGKTFSYTAYQLGVSYARYYTDKFAAGINIKFIQESYGPYSSTKGFAIDAGSIFHTGFGSWRLGMAVQNLGPDLKPSGEYLLWQTGEIREYSAAPLPAAFRLGLAGEVIDNPQMKLTLSVELYHPTDYAESISLGAKLRYLSIGYLSVGYRLFVGETPFPSDLNMGGLGFGFGVNYGTGPMKLGFSYSYSDMGILPDVHRFSLNYGF